MRLTGFYFWPCRVAFIATLVLSFWVALSHATHEIDHRFTVYGYVRDAEGRPLSGKTVAVTHVGGEKKATTTGSSGYYEVLLHLHNENRGDAIEIVTGEETKKIAAEFEPHDLSTVRKARVDFGAPATESSPLVWGGVVLGLVILSYFSYGYLRKSRKAAKRAQKRRKR